MNELKKCTVVSCDHPVQPSLYDGQPYCGDHYMEKLHGDFEAAYSKWVHVTQPLGKMRSLMGRMLEEVWHVNGGLLTKARLRDRAFNFLKEGRSFTFDITRHPNAFKNGYVNKRLVQNWKVDVTNGEVVMVSERAWQPGDSDGNDVV